MKTTTNHRSTTSRLNSLVQSLGGLARSCNDLRHCARCGDALTDPASWERGVGPVCAKKDTHLFAKTIPANFAMATIHTLNVTAESLPEPVQGIWTALTDVLLEKVERATKGTPDNQFMISGEDCRLVAKVIDFMLSFPVAPAPKRDLIAVVKYLGYVGLAGVLSGQSSTGAAELKFEGGKLFLTGSSNKSGFLAMRKIPGIVIPRRRGEGSYEAPATQHEAFIAAVMEFWPCFDGQVDLVAEKCKAWIAANPVVAAKQAKDVNKLQAKLTQRTEDFVLTFEWSNAVTRRIVDEIKTVTPRDRSYDPNTRAWTIKNAHKGRIVELMSENYSITETEGGVTPLKATGGSGYRPAYRSYRRW